MTTAAEASARVPLEPTQLEALHHMGLTGRQAEIFLYIFEHTRINGYQPSTRELGERFDIRSPNGVIAHIDSLSRKRWIDRSGGDSRAMRFVRGTDGEKFRGFTYQ